MNCLKNKKSARLAALLCIAGALALTAMLGCSAAEHKMFGFNRRDAVTSDPPPIGEGIESGVDGIIGDVESGVDDIIDGAESGVDDIIDGSMPEIFETNVPDSDINGAVKDDDSDGLSNPTDSDDDNDGTPDAADTDKDNDGISDKNDKDPDGDGIRERGMSATVGIIIALLVVGAVIILIIALMPKKKPPESK